MKDRGVIGVIAAFFLFGMALFFTSKKEGGFTTSVDVPTTSTPTPDSPPVVSDILYEKEVDGRLFVVRSITDNTWYVPVVEGDKVVDEVTTKVWYEVGTMTGGTFNRVEEISNFDTYDEAVDWINSLEERANDPTGPQKLPPKEKPKADDKGSIPQGTPSDATQDQDGSPYSWGTGTAVNM